MDVDNTPRQVCDTLPDGHRVILVSQSTKSELLSLGKDENTGGGRQTKPNMDLAERDDDFGCRVTGSKVSNYGWRHLAQSTAPRHSRRPCHHLFTK
jgi:hypothetical protein